MEQIENINKQIEALRTQKANLAGQQAQLDTRIAALQTQKANVQKANPDATTEKKEIQEDGEVVTSVPDGAINDTTLGDYKYYPKIGQTISRDYKKSKSSHESVRKFLNKKVKSM